LKQLLGASLVLDVSGDDIGRSRLLDIASTLAVFEHAEADTVLAAVKTIRFALRNDQGQFIRHVVEQISSLQEAEAGSDGGGGAAGTLDEGGDGSIALSAENDEARTMAALALDEAMSDLQELNAQLAIVTDEVGALFDPHSTSSLLRTRLVAQNAHISMIDRSMRQ
jgi:hypothetical protein